MFPGKYSDSQVHFLAMTLCRVTRQRGYSCSCHPLTWICLAEDADGVICASWIGLHGPILEEQTSDMLFSLGKVLSEVF